MIITANYPKKEVYLILQWKAYYRIRIDEILT